MKNDQIRNIAVIAHVDHGKTTLVDALLKQSQLFRENQKEMGQEQILDRNELERERGITIFAKTCAIEYQGIKINIVDTPGHADFSGEVERTLFLADGVLLIVDAQEGPMPQTRFVLKKSLALGQKVIVVINKIDKKLARVDDVKRKIEDLFLELAVNEDQLEYPQLYAVARRGAVFTVMPDDPEAPGTIKPLLELICSYIPAPESLTGTDFKMQVASLDYDQHYGTLAIGKIAQGEIKLGSVLFANGHSFNVTRIMTTKGLAWEEENNAKAGEIIALAGGGDLAIGVTLGSTADAESLPAVTVAKPTLSMCLGPNTSPFAGREGEYCTSKQLDERLQKELKTNLSLQVERFDASRFLIFGRGELHLAILLETLRREGFEMEVSKPEVVVRETDGVKTEPVEELVLTVANEFIGTITREVGKRGGLLINQLPFGDSETEFIYQITTRGLIGMRSFLLTATKGTAVLSSQFLEYQPLGSRLPKFRKGAMIAHESGEALAYGLAAAQARGVTFIGPATKVYAGMMIGLHAKENDLTINVCKGKKLTNMRSKASDGVIQLAPPFQFSLEQGLDLLEKDELLEITPQSLRLRKKYLTEIDRRRQARLDR